MDTLDSEIFVNNEENGCGLKLDLHMTCVVNSCQERLLEFILTYTHDLCC